MSTRALELSQELNAFHGHLLALVVLPISSNRPAAI